MAISLTERELSMLDSLVSADRMSADKTGADRITDVWVLAAGGSLVRCDIEGMADELAVAPSASAQTLEALLAHRTAATR